MNNIERFKSGDKRLQVVVEGMPDEQKILVQKGFFALGWSWYMGSCKNFAFLGGGVYTNAYYGKGVASDKSLLQSHEKVDDDYPTTSFTELMILANMESLPEVIPFLDENELKKYNSKQDDIMKNNEFTKDMLEDGMFVWLRGQDNDYSKGYWLVLNGKLLHSKGFEPLAEYNRDLTHPYGEHFDVVEVFTSERINGLAEDLLAKTLTSIWKRQSPEEVQRAEKKAELEKAILDAEEKIKVAKEALAGL